MLLYVAILVTLLASVSASPTDRILENEITQALQKYLAQYDPLTVPSITNLNLTNEHCSLIYNSTNSVIAGFSSMAVTTFVPPVPMISKQVTIGIKVGQLNYHTPNYKLNGTLNGNAYSAAGTGDLTIRGYEVTTKLKAEKFSLTSPVSLCVQKGTLHNSVNVEAILANFQGADEINSYINNNVDHIIQKMEDQMNTNAGLAEDSINQALCSSN